MYTIKEFANMLGVTPQTLRNKHKNGQLIPTLINLDTNYRLYSDEIAYRYNSNKYILAYMSKTENTFAIDEFKEKLDSLNIEYKMFIGDDSSDSKKDSLRELFREASKNSTYTILYSEENIDIEELDLIKFCLNACFPYIQIKSIDDFSLEKNLSFKYREDTVMKNVFDSYKVKFKIKKIKYKNPKTNFSFVTAKIEEYSRVDEAEEITSPITEVMEIRGEFQSLKEGDIFEGIGTLQLDKITRDKYLYIPNPRY